MSKWKTVKNVYVRSRHKMKITKTESARVQHIHSELLDFLEKCFEQRTTTSTEIEEHNNEDPDDPSAIGSDGENLPILQNPGREKK